MNYKEMTGEELTAELFVTKALAETEKNQHNCPGVTGKYWEYVRQITTIRQELERRKLQ